jgi:hypothetical protein
MTSNNDCGEKICYKAVADRQMQMKGIIRQDVVIRDVRLPPRC